MAITGDVLGIASAAQERRKKMARYEYRAPVILVVKTAAVQRQIEERKQAIIADLVEAEARKRALLEHAGRFPHAKDLMGICADITNSTIDEMCSSSRSRHVAWPRHFAMWVVRTIRFDMSLPVLGRLFGNRDHTTVMHALRNVEKYRDVPPFADWIADPRTQALLVKK